MVIAVIFCDKKSFLLKSKKYVVKSNHELGKELAVWRLLFCYSMHCEGKMIEIDIPHVFLDVEELAKRWHCGIGVIEMLIETRQICCCIRPVARMVVGAGLNPSYGIQHHNQLNPLCLVDDLMEPYRPIVDAMVYKMFDGRDDWDTELTPDTKRELAGIV